MLATKPIAHAAVNSATLRKLSTPAGKCRVCVRGLTASNRRSANRLKAIAALRAKTMQSTIPSSSRHENATGGVLRAFAAQAIIAANSANGSANSVWLKRIISSKWRSFVSIF